MYLLTIVVFIISSGFIAYIVWKQQVALTTFTGAAYTEQLWLHPEHPAVKDIIYSIRYSGEVLEVYADENTPITVSVESILRDRGNPFLEPIKLTSLVEIPEVYAIDYAEIVTLGNLNEAVDQTFTSTRVDIDDTIWDISQGDQVTIEIGLDQNNQKILRQLSLTKIQ